MVYVQIAGYFVMVSVISVAIYWILGLIYGLCHRPPIYFPLPLAAKMAVTGVLGTVFFMVGGLILATLVLRAEMMKRDDFETWPTVIAGVVISVIAIPAIYVSAFSLAFAYFD